MYCQVQYSYLVDRNALHLSSINRSASKAAIPHYVLHQSFPWNLPAVFAKQSCAKIALLLKVVEFLFTATALPCFGRRWKLIAVALWVPHRLWSETAVAVWYFHTRVAMQWALPIFVNVVRSETVRRRFGQNWFMLDIEQLLRVVNYGRPCERIKRGVGSV